MPGIEGGGGFRQDSGEHRLGFEPRMSQQEVHVGSVEGGIESGRMREITFEKARDVRLPSFLQLSPRVGICFVPAGISATRQGLMGVRESVPLFKGQMVSWQSEQELRKLNEASWETSEQMQRGVKAAHARKVPILNGKPILFAGANGNYARDGRLEDPNNPLFNFGMVGIDISSDRKSVDGSLLLSLAHELGHVGIFMSGEDRRFAQATLHEDRSLLVRNREQIAYYAHYLARKGFGTLFTKFNGQQIDQRLMSIRGLYEDLLPDSNFDHEYRLFHERHAWADGLSLLRSQPALARELHQMGLSKVFKYALRCLESYQIGYDDTRFTAGRRATDAPRIKKRR